MFDCGCDNISKYDKYLELVVMIGVKEYLNINYHLNSDRYYKIIQC